MLAVNDSAVPLTKKLGEDDWMALVNTYKPYGIIFTRTGERIAIISIGNKPWIAMYNQWSRLNMVKGQKGPGLMLSRLNEDEKLTIETKGVAFPELKRYQSSVRSGSKYVCVSISGFKKLIQFVRSEEELRGMGSPSRRGAALAYCIWAETVLLPFVESIAGQRGEKHVDFWVAPKGEGDDSDTEPTKDNDTEPVEDANVPPTVDSDPEVRVTKKVTPIASIKVVRPGPEVMENVVGRVREAVISLRAQAEELRDSVKNTELDADENEIRRLLDIARVYENQIKWYEYGRTGVLPERWEEFAHELRPGFAKYKEYKQFCNEYEAMYGEVEI